MNLGDLKTALKYFGFSDTDPLATWLNAALHEFEDAYPWPFLEAETSVAVVAGTNTLVLPSNFYKLMSLKIDGYGTRPEYMDLGFFEDEIEDRTVTGLPTVFTLVGTDSIRLYPTADTAYTFRIVYRKAVPDLAADIDVPAIPTRHHYTLVKGAAMVGLQAENEEIRARDAQTNFDGDILRAISRWSNKQEHQPDTVRDTAGYNE